MCNSGNTGFTKEEYLCTVSEADVIRRYGYDPCPNRGLTVLDFADPTGEIPRSEDQAALQAEQVDNALLIGGVLIIFALFIFAIR